MQPKKMAVEVAVGTDSATSAQYVVLTLDGQTFVMPSDAAHLLGSSLLRAAEIVMEGQKKELN